MKEIATSPRTSRTLNAMIGHELSPLGAPFALWTVKLVGARRALSAVGIETGPGRAGAKTMKTGLDSGRTAQ